MVGMVDHATMYVFFAYETQGENPILTILAYTFLSTMPFCCGVMAAENS